VAVALVAVLGGCAGSADGDGKKAASASASAKAARTATPSGGTVGAAGSDCPLPVRFDIARHWRARPVDAEAELSKTSKGSDGALTAALADSFLRVWTGKDGNADAGTVLRQFVAAEENTGKATYRTVRTGGGLSGVEVEYVYTSKLLEESRKETALAVSTPDGPVVLHLGGMDTEEREAMRPACELAKRTLASA
jgi:hypothetical protein